MKLLLVSGGMHRIITQYLIKKVDIINNKELELNNVSDFLQEVNPVFEAVLITDNAFSGHTEKDRRNLDLLLQWAYKTNKSNTKVIILTNDFMMGTELEDLCKRHNDLSFLMCEFVRIPEYLFRQAFEELLSEKRQISVQKDNQIKPDEGEKKKSFLDRFRPKPNKNESEIEATDKLTKDLENVSRGISRIVAVTGHRGSGITSTAINVACEAGKRGLNAIIIDMDIDYRSTNMYFSSFHDRTKIDEDINASLIRTLAKPQDYMTTAFNLKDKLWLASLGYGFSDRRLIDQFYNSNKLVGLLSVLRSKFNLVILDMPMDLFVPFREILIHIDVFGLCVTNNLHSILSTLRNVEVVLDKENISYLNAKSRVIVTKYNDRSRFQNDIFIPDRVSEVLTSGLSERFTYEMKVAGYVPYSNGFDEQIEMDVPLVNTSAEYEKAYGNILLRLMEGAK